MNRFIEWYFAIQVNSPIKRWRPVQHHAPPFNRQLTVEIWGHNISPPSFTYFVSIRHGMAAGMELNNVEIHEIHVCGMSQTRIKRRVNSYNRNRESYSTFISLVTTLTQLTQSSILDATGGKYANEYISDVANGNKHRSKFNSIQQKKKYSSSIQSKWIKWRVASTRNVGPKWPPFKFDFPFHFSGTILHSLKRTEIVRHFLTATRCSPFSDDLFLGFSFVFFGFFLFPANRHHSLIHTLAHTSQWNLLFSLLFSLSQFLKRRAFIYYWLFSTVFLLLFFF